MAPLIGTSPTPWMNTAATRIPGRAKKMVKRNRAYSKLLQAVKDAADHLEATGHKDRAAALRQQIADLEHLA